MVFLVSNDKRGHNAGLTFVTEMMGPGFIPLIREALFLNSSICKMSGRNRGTYDRVNPSGEMTLLASTRSAIGPTLATAEVVKARSNANFDLQSISDVLRKQNPVERK